jgi:hypothetical protein
VVLVPMLPVRAGSLERVALAGSSSGGGATRVRIYRVVGTTVLPADFNIRRW